MDFVAYWEYNIQLDDLMDNPRMDVETGAAHHSALELKQVALHTLAVFLDPK